MLVRTFAQPLTPAEQSGLVEALTRLCESPLDHPSIARPLVAGIEEGRPFLVHTLLPGVSLQRFLEEHGPQPFSEVVLRVTQLAAAIDFAAAAGVHHGDLGTRDIILDTESTGISGFGVMQALNDAGVGSSVPSHSGDVQALARMAFQLLTGRPLRELGDLRDLAVRGVDTSRVSSALAAALSDRPDVRPASALAFAATLQQAVVETPAAEAPVRSPHPLHGSAAAIDDLPLRPERDSGGPGANIGRILPIGPGPEPTVADPAPMLRDTAPMLRDTGPMLRDEPALNRPDGARPGRSVLSIAGAHAESAPEPESQTGWFLIAAALAIGILAGFTGGFIVGQRNDVPIPQFAAELLDRAVRSSRQPAAPPATDSALGTRGAGSETRVPESGMGPVPGTPDTGANTIQEPDIRSRGLDAGAAAASTDADRPAGAAPPVRPGSPNAPPRSAIPDSRSPSVSTPGTPILDPPSRDADPGSSARTDGSRAQPPAAPRVPPGTPGGLQVLSRPEGAQVFVDGALVGRTPLLIPSVNVGTHDVRLELLNHRSWATRVRVEAGARARVAASLELQTLP